MRLAFISSLLPTGRPDTGFEIANACIVEALLAAGCEVTMIGFLRQDEMNAPPPGAVVLARIAIENAGASATQKARWLADSVTTGLPVIAAKLARIGGQTLRAALARGGPFDAYVVNSAPVAAAFPWLLSEKPAALVAHNVEHRSALGNAESAGLFGGALYRREARLLRRAEHRALGEARFVWCLAEEDRLEFGVNIEHKSAVLPLLTPAPDRMPNAEPSFDVGLIGTWTWRPNLAGLVWFLDEVAPLLPENVSVAVAGRLPPGFASVNPRVRLLGRVPDAAEVLSTARCIALTSRTGTGVQLKTIETFQLGKPAVATRSSIRGLADLPTNCLVADEAQGFAAALGKLVLDVRSERTGLADGRAFAARQAEGLRRGVAHGLEALRVAVEG